MAGVSRAGVRDRRPRRPRAPSARCTSPTSPPPSLELGPYRHFMQKEIHEQPRALADTLEADPRRRRRSRCSSATARRRSCRDVDCGADPRLRHELLRRLGRALLDRVDSRRCPATVEIASEYRYRDSVPNPRSLVVTISQSGETLDTMEALKRAQGARPGAHARDLQRARERDPARVALRVLHPRRRRDRGRLDQGVHDPARGALHADARARQGSRAGCAAPTRRERLEALRICRGASSTRSTSSRRSSAWAEQFAHKAHALFLGRGIHYPIALEGALKLKEISYIHAEAYPAGELKHGPLALVDAAMPVVVIAPNDALLEKVKSNMQEVRARGGELYVFADLDSHFTASEGVHVIRTPRHAGRALAGRARDPGAAARLQLRHRARHRRRQAAEPGEVGDGRVASAPFGRGPGALLQLQRRPGPARAGRGSARAPGCSRPQAPADCRAPRPRGCGARGRRRARAPEPRCLTR